MREPSRTIGQGPTTGLCYKSYNRDPPQQRYAAVAHNGAVQ